MSWHFIEEDLGLTSEGLGPEAPFEEPITWFSRAIDDLEDEIGRSFRNHSLFDRWLEANEPSFEPDLELEWEVGPDVEIIFTPFPSEPPDE